MSPSLPEVYLVRHGDTAWSLTGQHTGRTDLPLTTAGEQAAQHLREPLSRISFTHVFTSPLQRAVQTSALAGFGERAIRNPDLMEWDYGAYNGRTSAEIQTERPGWLVFRDGCPEGESPEQITARADRVLHQLRRLEGTVLLFSHGHFLRTLTARWCGWEVAAAAHLMLQPAGVSVLSYERSLENPAILRWNQSFTR
ncbi:histidine phosphatase family protein [Planctomicrobium sp. SH664]|uniref:histidine phosphatase family protein n=1 Tax=Planctomicrobium sp. SH664 TaxID=3448125 RepID=UPI003F5B8EAE